jgi:hypothetical protein
MTVGNGKLNYAIGVAKFLPTGQPKELGLDSQKGVNFFIKVSRAAMGPTQPPTQWGLAGARSWLLISICC